MQIELIATLVTGLLNLLATLRQSRCTEIDSECGCFKFHVERELQNNETQTENKLVSFLCQKFSTGP